MKKTLLVLFIVLTFIWYFGSCKLVNADELRINAVNASIDTEDKIEAVVDLQDLQGAVTDVQVPDDITIDLSTLATNITASANNSTNETVYPLFVDGATGTQGTETDTGLSYNPSTGIITAEGYSVVTTTDGGQYTYFYEDTDLGSNFTGWGVYDNVTADTIYALPLVAPTAGQIMVFAVPGNQTMSDGTTKSVSVGSWASAGTTAADISIEEVGTATYDDVQDWVNITQSAGIISGGTFTDESDGDITVAAGEGFVKDSTALSATKFITWSELTNLTMVDGDTNYIYVYDNAGTPTITSTTTEGDIDHLTEIKLGKVYQDGTVAHILNGGVPISNFARTVHYRLGSVEGFKRESGLVTSETGTRNVKVTAGIFWKGLNAVSLSEFDTNVSGSFSLWYYDHTGWVEVTSQTALTNEQYNDYGANPGLVNIGTAKFGNFWVYLHEDGDVHILYGLGSYSFGEAEAQDAPVNLPEKVSSMGVLVARIILAQTDADDFEQVDTAWVNGFTPTVVSDHNNLGGLQGGTADEYYHLTSAQATIVTRAATNGQSGYATAAQITALEAAGATPLDDIGDPDAATTIGLDDGEYITINSAEDAGTVLTINMTDNDAGGNLYGLDIIQAGDANNFYRFLRCYDNTSDLQLEISSNGNLDTEGTLTAGSWILSEYGSVISRQIIDTAATGAALDLQRKRDGDPSDDISNEDYIGEINFDGYHTDEYSPGAIIRAIVDNTPGEDDMPSRLEFLVSPDGSDTPVLAMAIDAIGNIDFQDGNITTSGLIINTVQTIAVTTEANLTITGSIVVLNGDDDTDHDTVDLQDGVSGQMLRISAGTNVDSDDTIIMNYSDTTCTNCPAVTMDKTGEGAVYYFNGSTWVCESINTGL